MDCIPPDWLEVTKLVINCLTLVSIGIAYFSYRANLVKVAEDRARERDKELIAQAQKSFQWAYDVLTQGGRHSPPIADRLNWLTCARHLLRGEKIAEKISSETYKLIYAEINEYWRNMFFLALDHQAMRFSSYYLNKLENQTPIENIEIKSALTVIRFSNWRNDVDDPVDSVSEDMLIEEPSNFSGYAWRGLKEYIFALRNKKRDSDVIKN